MNEEELMEVLRPLAEMANRRQILAGGAEKIMSRADCLMGGAVLQPASEDSIDIAKKEIAMRKIEDKGISFTKKVKDRDLDALAKLNRMKQETLDVHEQTYKEVRRLQEYDDTELNKALEVMAVTKRIDLNEEDHLKRTAAINEIFDAAQRDVTTFGEQVLGK